jgi:DnaJ-class molecular chaperone
MPDLRKKTRHGDLFVQLNVEIPEQLSKRQKELFEELLKLQNS